MVEVYRSIVDTYDGALPTSRGWQRSINWSESFVLGCLWEARAL
jgi:hypothetical protein